jgi:RNA polymerase sigma-70 factor (ECF subfamily)
MALTSVDEKKLINRAIHREPEAFSDLYLKYQPFVLRHVHYLVGNRQEAEDITSETFLRAWNSIHRFEERGFSIRSWLLKIAYNLRNEHFRHLGRHSGHRDLADLEDEILDPDPRISPEWVIESVSQWEPIGKALQKLPKPQRQVIVLRFLGDLSYEEIHSIIGKSVGATRVIQHRALKALQKMLQPSDFLLINRRVSVADAQEAVLAAGTKLQVASAD